MDLDDNTENGTQVLAVVMSKPTFLFSQVTMHLY